MHFATLFVATVLIAPSSKAFTYPNFLKYRHRAIHKSLWTSSLSSMPHDDDEMPFYAMGVNYALQVNGAETLLTKDELDMLVKGFSDTLHRASDVDTRTVLQTYGPTLNDILSERNKKKIDGIKLEGAAFIKNFLDCNEDATQTESGLVYCEMTRGDGVTPTSTSTVEVHYHGTLIDGTVFDSSVDRGETISFPLGNVIKGWQEGLQLMKEGGKAVLLCPSDIAYGDKGNGPVIPPGATLKFEVELIQVTTPPEPEEQEPIRINLDEIISKQQKQ